jgi:hypothetical protein
MMNLHGVLVLTHVLAMVGLFSTLTIEGLAVSFLRRAITYEQAREWARLWVLLPLVGAPSILLSLASGIYLATALDSWRAHWVAVAVPTLVVVAIAGGVTAPSRTRVRAAIGSSDDGPLPADIRRQLRQALHSSSWRVRTALLLALVVDMVVTPDAAITLVVVFTVAGLTWSIPQWMKN